MHALRNQFINLNNNLLCRMSNCTKQQQSMKQNNISSKVVKQEHYHSAMHKRCKYQIDIKLTAIQKTRKSRHSHVQSIRGIEHLWKQLEGINQKTKSKKQGIDVKHRRSRKTLKHKTRIMSGENYRRRNIAKASSSSFSKHPDKTLQ